ncbi:MAG: hypothetical protein AUH80_08665 [Chloroflexi bacterium 13_1_40CM_4_65_16]|nr:MAG: hypothetical protein AUH80_08665 [Chloroflexi bacterium 13_1_40CM_4_65_16]
MFQLGGESVKDQTAIGCEHLGDVDKRSDSTDIAEDEASQIEMNADLTIQVLCQCVRQGNRVADVYFADKAEPRRAIRAFDQELTI